MEAFNDGRVTRDGHCQSPSTNQGRQQKKSTEVLNLFQKLIIIVKNQFEYARGGKVSVMANEYML